MNSEEDYKKQARSLFLEGRYEELSKFADFICASAVDNNEEFIWQTEVNDMKDTRWNCTSYGNMAYLIHNGAKFPERRQKIEEYKSAIIKVATASL